MPDKKQFERVIIHCSDSKWGTAEIIRQWHIERGKELRRFFKRLFDFPASCSFISIMSAFIHYVILNG